MPYKLNNPPLKLVVCTIKVADHPDINSLVGTMHGELLDTQFQNYTSQPTQNMNFHFSGAVASPSVTSGTQHLYTDTASSKMLRITGNELCFATTKYVDFVDYMESFNQILALLAGFPPISAVSMRYINRIETSTFPSPLIAEHCQALMSNDGHNHLDLRIWKDLGGNRSSALIISATNPHGPGLAAAINLPPKFLEGIKTKGSGIVVDLMYDFGSAQLQFNDEFIQELDLQRNYLAETFLTITTEEAKKEWQFQEVPS